MQQTDDRSLKELLGDLTQNVTTLFRKEIELARAETSEKITQAGVAAGSIAAGGILALAALIVLLQALVIALTELGLAPALSSLIVGGVVAIIAFALIYKGINDLKGSNLAPTPDGRVAEARRAHGEGAGPMSTQYDTNPGSKSPEEVQREARQSRAEVEQTWMRFKSGCRPASCSNRRWITSAPVVATTSCAISAQEFETIRCRSSWSAPGWLG